MKKIAIVLALLMALLMASGCKSQDQIDEKEETAAILGGKIREAPDVPQTHGTAGSGKDEA